MEDVLQTTAWRPRVCAMLGATVLAERIVAGLHSSAWEKERPA